MTVLVGCDPEFFLRKGNQHVSAHDIVPGDKSKPFPLSFGAVQADGTAVEFNIQPAINPSDFVRNIEQTIADIRRMVPRELEFDFTPSILYPLEYFDALPKGSKELGCDPDFNAWTGTRNTIPNLPANLQTMRTGAGHIHIGWTKDADPQDRSHFWDCCELVKALDVFFEYPVKLWDQDQRRSRLYGARGAFRPKPYGCEYRVLSNAWLKHPKLWPWLFDAVQFVFEFTKENKRTHYAYDAYEFNTNTINDLLQVKYGYYNTIPKIPQNWSN